MHLWCILWILYMWWIASWL